jgi:fructosamine-3-kinase
LFDQQSRPVLIDPAVYRGCREAEWGMIVWFGGCPAAFTDGYLRRWPLPDGWRRRVNVYLLYHQLNHLNLFGGSYASACRSTAAEILSAAQ